MEANCVSRAPQIIEIEEDDVIDLDGAEKTPEEVVYEWDAKIRNKLSMFAVADNESVLGDLMKDYLQSLQEMARIYEDNESLKNKVFCHISFLYSYYVELQCCTPDNYLSNMEDILASYCNLELEVIRPLKRKDMSKREYKRRILSVCRRIIHVLTVYLLERNDHILHVLIKMNTNSVSDSWSEVLNVLYTHFLTKVPAFNLCDESFCRSYILFQKWKEIRKIEDWEGMDKIMYKMFKRTPESVRNNEVLRQILMPACDSTVGIVLNLFRSFWDISSAYFKHITTKRNNEMDDLDFNIDLGEDEPTLPIEEENDEEVTFLKAYYEVERNMSNLTRINDSLNANEVQILTRCKQEVDEDDDVEFIGIVTPQPPPRDTFVLNDVDGNSNMSDKEEESITMTPLPQKDLQDTPNVVTVPTSSSSPERPETPVEETNQPKVPLVSNTTQIPSPSDSDGRTIEMKSVEIQADTGAKDYVYNDYGLTTPPFDVPSSDEHTSRSCLYTNIDTRTVEVQVDPPPSSDKTCYNDYGLTPPNDTPIDDHNSRLEENCLYTNIGQNHKEAEVEASSPDKNDAQIAVDELEDVDYEPEILPNTKKKAAEEPECHKDDSEYEDMDISDMNIQDVDYDTEEIDVESCHEPLDDQICAESVNLEVKIASEASPSEKSDYSGFQSGDQIDTGQKIILNTAPSIEKEAREPDTFNGNTVLKPLLTSNRTNGQARDIGSGTKIVYTSSQKIRSTNLDDFSKFESAIQVQWNKMKENHDFEEILTGPVTKITPTKHAGGLIGPHDKLDIFESNSRPPASASSRSNSPAEMTSPAYEAIDDFRNYFSDSVNGRVPPPHDVRVPQGILKKANSTRKKNFRIVFHESTADPSEERRARSDGVLVLKRVRRDRKLNMEPRVVVDRLAFIENKMKKVLNNPPTLRVDYDKTTRHINEKDVVRCISPPKFSWIIDFARSRPNAGKVEPSEEAAREDALSLTIPDDPVAPETEFSNSPKFLPDPDKLVRLLENPVEAAAGPDPAEPLLCDNSNFYKDPDDSVQLPTAVPESYDFEKNLKNEVFSKVDCQDDSDGETRLPLKKRKLSVASKDEEISYPATPMISIAEVEALHLRKLQTNSRPFKTPAERKEMPPLPVFYNVDSDPSPIITDQFNINNHTYNNPTINYHMNNVPVPFINIPCGSYYSLPPILVPFNNVSGFDQKQQQEQGYAKKESNRKQGRQRRRH